MDLLKAEREKEQNEKMNQKRKLVLKLLVLSIALLILLVIIMIVIPEEKPPETLNINIDGKEVAITEGLVIESQDGKVYISIEKMADLIGYSYYNGEYLKYTEDKEKCYLENEYQIIGFGAKNKVAYKLEPADGNEYQHLALKNEIIMYNEKLYIELQDLRNIV